MNLPKNLLISDLRELIIAFSATLAIIAIILLAAVASASRTDRPIEPDERGRIVLTPWLAKVSGNLELYPTSLEKQNDHFTYTHGRAVLRERQERKVKNWTSPEDRMTWRVQVDEAGRYQVRARYACDRKNAGSEITLDLSPSSRLNHLVKTTGGPEQWENRKWGEPSLARGLHSLTLSARPAAGEVMRLEKIELIPLDPQ